VILECVIDPRGRVAEVKVLRGVPLLEEAAVDAVRQWVYTPTLMDGVPVPVLLTVTVRFGLTS
jgi:protein TonB